MDRKTCAFTGHRPQFFPWGYNESDSRCVKLKEELSKQILFLVRNGYTDYLSGMALGADVWAAQTVLTLREKCPELKLHCILPCLGQERAWSEESKALYFSIVKQADSRVYTSRAYYKKCMLDRNRFMVERSDLLLAVYSGISGGGTAYTVNYSRRLGRKIIILDPLTMNVVQSKPI